MFGAVESAQVEQMAVGVAHSIYVSPLHYVTTNYL